MEVRLKPVIPSVPCDEECSGVSEWNADPVALLCAAEWFAVRCSRSVTMSVVATLTTGTVPVKRSNP